MGSHNLQSVDRWSEAWISGWSLSAGMGVCGNLEEESLPCVVLSLDVALSRGVVTIEWNCRTLSQYLKPLLGGDETHFHRALMTRTVA